jgi:hypothetical protein
MGLESDSIYRPELTDRAHSGPPWTLAGRVSFRFVCIYLILYILPFPITAALGMVIGIYSLFAPDVPDLDAETPFVFKYVVTPVGKYVTRPYAEFWDEAVLWTGKKVFHVDIEYRPAGSGDTTWNYVQIFDFAVLSAAVTVLWTLVAGIWWRIRGRSRLGYPHLHEWLRVFVRFNLASTMLGYGSVKVIKLQFSYPGPDTLLHTYGESSPMHLLWTFMGASDGYTWFTGAGEVVAGLLLCTRRTTLLGAIMTLGVMIHVVALNFCYDVPVKLFSSHLALMALFLAAPDLPWLTRVFVLGQRTTPRGYVPLVRRRWLDWTLFLLRTVLVLTEVGLTFYQCHENSKHYGRLAPEAPLSGLWEVEEFVIDGKERPPLTTDADRWQRLVFQSMRRFQKSQPETEIMMIRTMTGKSILTARAVVNEDEKTIALTPFGGQTGGSSPPIGLLGYWTPEERVMVVKGEMKLSVDGKTGTKQVEARLRYYGKEQFLLSNRGFHWINEMPYNRFGPKNEGPPQLPPPPPKRE